MGDAERTFQQWKAENRMNPRGIFSYLKKAVHLRSNGITIDGNIHIGRRREEFVTLECRDPEIEGHTFVPYLKHLLQCNLEGNAG